MNKKELVYAIILAASLFSLSLLLFSQRITSLSVSLSEEQPFAVAVPTMFTMNKVLIMLVLTSIGTYSLTMLTASMEVTQKITNPAVTETVIGNQFPLYQEEDTNEVDYNKADYNNLAVTVLLKKKPKLLKNQNLTLKKQYHCYLKLIHFHFMKLASSHLIKPNTKEKLHLTCLKEMKKNYI